MAPNPLFVGGHFHKKLQATVIMDIWPEVLFFSAIATSESPVKHTDCTQCGVL